MALGGRLALGPATREEVEREVARLAVLCLPGAAAALRHLAESAGSDHRDTAGRLAPPQAAGLARAWLTVALHLRAAGRVLVTDGA